MQRMALLACLIFSIAAPVRAQDTCLQPNSEVMTAVLVRDAPTLDGKILDRIAPQEQGALLGEIPEWFLVRTSKAKHGFGSKQWLAPTACTPEAPSDQSFMVHAIDVGTGLAIFVQGPDFTLLYDGGSNDDIAKGDRNRLLAYLKTAMPDLKRIDHVVLSHPHRDHVELLADVLDAYAIGDVWNSGARNDICGFRAFLRVIADQGLRYHTATANFGQSQEQFDAGCAHEDEALGLRQGARITTDPIRLGQDASMRFLYVDGDKHSDLNDNSLVLRLDLGGHRVLLPGDAGAGRRASPDVAPDAGSIESVLLACCRQELAADLLIVGHHGSMTSSRQAFLEAVGAHDFLVSSGPFRYSGVQLPDAQVIAALEARGTVWRTDREDEACKESDDKIGPAADGKAGGCSNVVFQVTPAGVQGEYRTH